MKLLDLYQSGGSADVPATAREEHDKSLIDPTQGARIGDMLIAQGLLDQKDVDDIVDCQKERGLRFGEAGIRLRRIKPRDVEHALAQQYACPYPQPDEFAAELVAAYQPAQRVVETFRMQRSMLLQRWFNAEPRALAFVSPNIGEGRSFLVANLAVLFAQLGRETLVIDADLRRSRQHEIFRVDNKCGLSSVLSGRMRGERIHRLSTLNNLAVLPAGPQPPNPLDLLSRDRFASLMLELRRRFHIILVDTPAAGRHADAQVIGGVCRGALMMTRMQRTQLADAQLLATRLKQARAEVVGAVLNRF
jgi:protein-tyrosine kinase